MGKFNPRGRRSIRLKGYDYSQAGAYFVTAVTWQRNCLFGEILDGEMKMNDFGRIADECWESIPQHFQNVELGAYIVMPNHVHGIIVIHGTDENGAAELPPPVVVGASLDSPLLPSPRPHGAAPRSLGAIVGSFKSAVAKRIGRELNATGIWQRNYYEHIIRNEREMDRIWRYIESNPRRWAEDTQNPPNQR